MSRIIGDVFQISNGNVGLGTATPINKLHVEGASYLNGTITTNNNSINAGSGIITATTFSGTATQVSQNLTRGTYLTGNNYNGSVATTWAVDADSANTASKVVVRDASGNFSAGTITATLSGTATQVSQNLTRGTYLTGNDYNGSVATTWAVDATTAATASKIVARDAAGDIYANHIGIGTAAARQLLDVQGGNLIVSGNIGVGTFVNPTYKLHVDGNVLITGQVTTSNLSVIGDYTTMNTVSSNTEQMVITNDGTGPALKVTQTGPQPIADFYDDNNVLALRVADGGNIGIGTTNPTQKLYVNGGLLASSIQIGNVTYAHVPTGIIVLWSSSTGTIPTGWAICDGTNGTPDLRDRFIIGAGSTYAVGATGGANTITLTSNNLPPHTHTGFTSTDGAHTHNYDKSDIRTNITGGGGQNAGAANYTSTATSSAGSHSHSITTNFTSNANSSPINILPPYYALAYIMKL